MGEVLDPHQPNNGEEAPTRWGKAPGLPVRQDIEEQRQVIVGGQKPFLVGVKRSKVVCVYR